MHVVRGDSADPHRAVREIFTGEVHSHSYVDDKIGAHLRMGLVRFSPGGRTKWHRHSFEQGLLITEGTGIVATDEGEYVVGPGDIVIVPAGEKHWHGSGDGTAMAHISITTPGETTVLEAVERPASREPQP